jgi:hypothetical protein
MFDFDSAKHERNLGYYLAHFWEPFRLIFVFAFLVGTYPFRALWDGRRDIDSSISLRWLAVFVLAILVTILAGIKGATVGDWSLLIGFIQFYSGVCLMVGLIGVLLIIPWQNTDQIVFIDP